MKKQALFLFIYFSCLFSLPFGEGWGEVAAQGGTWVWVKGSKLLDQGATWGTMGVPALTNTPQALYECATWIDLSGNFWIFGGLDVGQNETSTLWRYDPANNIWTWMKGPTNPNQPGVWGTQGVSAPANNPPCRGFGTIAWTDLTGDLWMYGGTTDSANLTYQLGDLWKYNIASNQWTWMSGTKYLNRMAVYGAQGVLAPGNMPGGRWECNSAWVDANNDLWFFGGQDRWYDYYCDLWKYNIASNQWAWMKGPQLGNQPYSYGTKGVETASNIPPGRASYTHWKDAIGNFYIWGGVSSPNWDKDYSDVWKYNPITNNWTWIAGDSIPDTSGIYNSYCTYTGNFGPRARYENRSAQLNGCTNAFYTFGGYRFTPGGGTYQTLNDLWLFNSQTNQWKWVSGTDSLNAAGNYGSLGVSSPFNIPPARGGPSMWIDDRGVLWLFGGMVGNSQTDKFNDVWKFIPDNTCLGIPVVGSNGVIYQLSDTTLCRGDSTYLTFLGGYGVQISPSANITWLDTADAVLHPDTTTTYMITGQSYCRAGTDTNYIMVLVSAPAVSISADTTVICANDSAQICATAGFTTYNWNVGNSTACITTQLAGNYYVTATDNFGCTATSNHIAITVHTMPPVSISVNGDTLTSYNAVTYQWYLNGNPIGGATSQTYVAAQAGSYTVAVTDTNGCFAFSTAVIISGIPNLSEDKVSVYPNPNSVGSWQLAVGNELVGSQLEIFDDRGRLVLTTNIKHQTSNIELNVEGGIYLLRISSAKKVITRKLIKL